MTELGSSDEIARWALEPDRSPSRSRNSPWVTGSPGMGPDVVSFLCRIVGLSSRTGVPGSSARTVSTVLRSPSTRPGASSMKSGSKGRNRPPPPLPGRGPSSGMDPSGGSKIGTARRGLRSAGTGACRSAMSRRTSRFCSEDPTAEAGGVPDLRGRPRARQRPCSHVPVDAPAPIVTCGESSAQERARAVTPSCPACRRTAWAGRPSSPRSRPARAPPSRRRR